MKFKLIMIYASRFQTPMKVFLLTNEDGFRCQGSRLHIFQVYTGMSWYVLILDKY